SKNRFAKTSPRPSCVQRGLRPSAFVCRFVSGKPDRHRDQGQRNRQSVLLCAASDPPATLKRRFRSSHQFWEEILERWRLKNLQHRFAVNTPPLLSRGVFTDLQEPSALRGGDSPPSP